MKKKVLALILSTALVAGLFAGCGSSSSDADTDADAAVEETTDDASDDATAEDTAAEEEEAVVEEVTVEPEDLPDAFAYISFDGEDEGYSALIQVEDVGTNTGATYGLEATEVDYVYTDGVAGSCLYIDGTFGLDLGLEATETDAYTVSFWVWASRLADYGATLQIGHSIGMAADVGNDVTWINVTQTSWSTKYFPTIWSRNESSDADDGTDCWPWMAAFQEGDEVISGKKEWAMITIVCTGNEQASPLGDTTVGAQLYIDGVLVYDSDDNYANGTYFEYTWDATLAPNVMKTNGYEFESYFGINYWDTVFKGFVDELYVYDTALTAGQVVSLYQLGDPTVEPSVEE